MKLTIIYTYIYIYTQNITLVEMMVFRKIRKGFTLNASGKCSITFCLKEKLTHSPTNLYKHIQITHMSWIRDIVALISMRWVCIWMGGGDQPSPFVCQIRKHCEERTKFTSCQRMFCELYIFSFNLYTYTTYLVEYYRPTNIPILILKSVGFFFFFFIFFWLKWTLYWVGWVNIIPSCAWPSSIKIME